ncbi:unnamed protein product [Staurois parvus]|uniref:Uncharacterized protein n=1 Tax=Staurois parvus TaxID=386267 RepID=A0ABN9H574_9NEOB|nr:unnamed protein product [Staurois parvus]
MAEWEQWEAVQGPRSHCGPSSSHEESVRGPMADYVPGSSKWEARNLPSTLCQKIQHTSSVRRPESGTWQSVAMETAAMGGRTGTHERLWT